MIVGTKKTLIRGGFDRDGFAKVTEITNELHATKGWRTVQTRHGRTKDRRLAILSEAWFPTPRAKDVKRIQPIEITEKMLLRHKWYRIEKEREARLAATEAYNEAAQ